MCVRGVCLHVFMSTALVVGAALFLPWLSARALWCQKQIKQREIRLKSVFVSEVVFLRTFGLTLLMKTASPLRTKELCRPKCP